MLNCENLLLDELIAKKVNSYPERFRLAHAERRKAGGLGDFYGRLKVTESIRRRISCTTRLYSKKVVLTQHTITTTTAKENGR